MRWVGLQSHSIQAAFPNTPVVGFFSNGVHYLELSTCSVPTDLCMSTMQSSCPHLGYSHPCWMLYPGEIGPAESDFEPGQELRPAHINENSHIFGYTSVVALFGDRRAQ